MRKRKNATHATKQNNQYVRVFPNMVSYGPPGCWERDGGHENFHGCLWREVAAAEVWVQGKQMRGVQGRLPCTRRSERKRGWRRRHTCGDKEKRAHRALEAFYISCAVICVLPAACWPIGALRKSCKGLYQRSLSL